MVRGGYGPPQTTHIGHENGQTHAIRKTCAFGLGDKFHVHECLPDAGLFAFNQPIIRRVDAAHAGDEYKSLARAPGLQVPVGAIAP
jgi:hypothetical protein